MKTYFRELSTAIAVLSFSACVQVNPDKQSKSVEFQTDEFYATESDGIATITVVRKGSADDPASVSYSMSPDSATPGIDFETKSGLLSWDAGESSEKTFEIPIYSDSELERQESVILTLGGADGVELGEINRATLNIVDSECAGQLSENINNNKILDQSCYLVTNDIYVHQGGKLVIDPGVTLIFEAGTKIQVEDNGSLVATGLAEQPILMTGAQKTAGYWNGLEFFGSDKDDNYLSHVNIEYAGAAPDSAAFTVRNSSEHKSTVSIDHLSVSHSLGYGFELSEGSKISLFSGVTANQNIQGAGKIPLELIPIIDSTSCRFTGNQRDYVDVTHGDISEDQSWPALDVPYAFEPGIYTVTTTLNIEPGARLAFDQDSQLIIEDEGVLTALGTNDNPIHFFGLGGFPGSWGGIEFAGSPSQTPSQMDYCEIYYGGGGDSPANISLTGRTGLSLVNLTNSYVTHSLKYGIWLNSTDAYLQQSNNSFFTNAAGDQN